MILLLKVSTRKTYCVPLINQKQVYVLIYWVLLIYKEHGRTKKWNVCLYNLIGNKDTLDTIPKSKGINTRDELLKFHSKYYSSNIMSLAVLGKGEWRILLLYRLYWGKQFQYINHIWMMNHAFWHMFSTAVHMIWGI